MYKKISIAVIFFILLPAVSFSQKQKKKSVIITVKGKAVYVYQPKILSGGSSFNIYRKYKSSGKFVKLNSAPITGAANPSELINYLGNSFNKIAGELNAVNASDLFLKLHSDDITAELYSDFYPAVAGALGRLFIDSTAVNGSKAEYKVEYLNNSGAPIGETLTKTIIVKQTPIPAPSGLSAANKGIDVTLNWNYPKPSGSAADHVIRFNVYRINNKTKEPEMLNRDIILRDGNKSEFSFDFTAGGLKSTVRFFVTAVSMTGEESKPSGTLSYTVKDNIPPRQVEDVKAAFRRKRVLISWNVCPDLDVKGYYVYRSLSDKTHLKKINARLINPDNPFTEDSAVVHGKSYLYRVTAVDSSGNESSKSVSAFVRIPFTARPKNPGGLKAVLNKNNTVTLSWNYPGSKSNLKSFVVLRKNTVEKNTEYMTISRPYYKLNSIVDSGTAGLGFNEGWSYKYGVAAVGKSNLKSDTIFTSLEIPDTTKPLPPQFVNAKNNDGVNVFINWSNSESGDVGFYVVKRKTINTENFKTLVKVMSGVRSYKDGNVKAGTKYLYTVTAIDTIGNIGIPTKPDTVFVRDFDPPGKVRNVRAEISKGKLKISWEPCYDHDLAGYKVYESNLETGIYKPIDDKLIEETGAVFNNQDNDSWYIVKSEDTSGNESIRSEPVQPYDAEKRSQ